MIRSTLNLGILAHVDAGKTSLTERLLFDNGAIERLGSVDAGSTQTDSGDLERERGITIRSAVAAFTTGDRQINLVDTPGHPDFIAEVERALSVLDGAVLVLSAVEGVQAQTRVLMRSLRRLRLPTLLFVNKIDRMGARDEALLADIRARLAPLVVPMSEVRGAGTAAARAPRRSLDDPAFRTRVAETLAEVDEDLLARLVAGQLPGPGELRALLGARTAAGQVHPVFFGSALTGEGVAELTAGIREFLPPPQTGQGGPARGTVFAVERGEGGEKIAYLRLFSGEVRARQRLTLRRREPGGAILHHSGRVAGLDLVRPAGSAAVPRDQERLRAGGIARIRGLASVRVGDRLGEVAEPGEQRHFSPPGLEVTVRPEQPGHKARLHAALTRLADEDPLIRTRVTADGATSVLLYGAVQQEVIAERLRRDFGVTPVFARPRPVYVERPVGVGEACEEMAPGVGRFWATIGLRVEPAAPGSGVRYRHQVEWGALPRTFHRAVEAAALRTLEQGLYGWEVTDCTVTLFRVGYHSPDSKAADFRDLTPMVLLRALQQAGSRVYEPCQALEIEIPRDTLSTVAGALAAREAEIVATEERGESWAVFAEVPTRRVQEVRAELPGLSRGEATVFARPGTHRPVRGRPPQRARTDGNPLNREEYLRHLAAPELSRV